MLAGVSTSMFYRNINTSLQIKVSLEKQGTWHVEVLVENIVDEEDKSEFRPNSNLLAILLKSECKM